MRGTAIAAALLCLVAVGCGGGEEKSVLSLGLVEAWTAEGEFRSPQAAVHDTKRDVIYVSNLGADEETGDGFISILSPTGEIVEPRWIEGLDSTTGLAMSSDSLFVVDADRLMSISIPEGKIVSVYAAPDA